jgi:hypothetical protein
VQAGAISIALLWGGAFSGLLGCLRESRLDQARLLRILIECGYDEVCGCKKQRDGEDE